MKDIEMTPCTAEKNAELNAWMRQYGKEDTPQFEWEDSEWGLVAENKKTGEKWYRVMDDPEQNIIQSHNTLYLDDDTARNQWGEGYEIE